MRNRKRFLNRKRVRNLFATFVVAISVGFAIQNVRDRRAESARLAKVHATEALLDTPVRVEVGMRFDEALRAMHEETGLNILVKWDLIEKSGIPRSRGVHVAGGHQTLGGVLQSLLQCAGGGTYNIRASPAPIYNNTLDFYMDRWGRVVVTTYADAIQCAGAARVYDLRGMQLPDPDLSRRHSELEWLLVGSGAEPREWIEDSETLDLLGTWCSPRTTVSPRNGIENGRVVVIETEDAHRRIQRLLKRIHDDPKLLTRIRFHHAIYM